MNDQTISRRTVLRGLGLAALTPLTAASLTARAETAAAPQSPAPANTASQLPLRTTGLEHLGTVVPDVEAAGKFYGRLFNPELYKEKDPPLRYYVTLGVGYLALGSRANQPRAFFDHFCALVQDYDAPAMAQQLQSAGLPAGRYGIIPDPDNIGLQLLGVPGGLAKTTEPAGRIVDGDPLVHPQHLDHVLLHVTDLDKSLQFYRRFFGQETQSGTPGTAASFQVAGTRLLLQKTSSDESPGIARIGIQVQPFDRKALTRELTKLGAHVAPDSTKDLRFTDPSGLTLALQAA